MQGRLVRLTRPTDADYRLIERWLSSANPVAPLTGDLGADLTAEQLKQADTREHRFFTVRLLGDDRAVGTVNYRRESPGCFSVGGAVGDPALWQKGYGADAFIVLVDHLFHTCNARKVQAMVMMFNKGSLQMVTHTGFVCDGVLREHCYLDGHWHDATLWSMLRAEFYERVRRDTQISEQLAVRDLVPERDKAEARQIFADYLRTAGGAATALGRYLAEADPPVVGRDNGPSGSGRASRP